VNRFTNQKKLSSKLFKFANVDVFNELVLSTFKDAGFNPVFDLAKLSDLDK
tara:strand:+ start:52 stop:204 length:153 start_codon:yes stop_codon:yes gene_type:complete